MSCVWKVSNTIVCTVSSVLLRALNRHVDYALENTLDLNIFQQVLLSLLVTEQNCIYKFSFLLISSGRDLANQTLPVHWSSIRIRKYSENLWLASPLHSKEYFTCNCRWLIKVMLETELRVFPCYVIVRFIAAWRDNCWNLTISSGHTCRVHALLY